MKSPGLPNLPYHNLRRAMQPLRLACATVGHNYFLRTLPDIQDLLEPLERAITDVLIPAVTDHTLSEGERELLSFPVRMGGLGFTNPVECSASQYETSVKVTEPLVKQIMEQVHQPPDVHEMRTVLLSTRKQKDDYITERFE